MPEKSLTEYVARLRKTAADARLVACELWRRAVLENGSDADARAADARLVAVEASLADAERALEERHAQQALCCRILVELDKRGPLPSTRELARLIDAKPAHVQRALADLSARREVVRSIDGYTLPIQAHARVTPIALAH